MAPERADGIAMSATADAGLRQEPLRVLIAALGGQGGGVLTEWIVEAARAGGFAAQATSIPGVSQRTGATTYYVEIAAVAPGEPAPVLGLAPVPGRVDALVCAELLEAARMVERGMSTASRTVVVASTHRVYTTREKMSGGDARFDGARIVAALRALSRHAVLVDMEAIRARHGAAISAVLFGALAGSGALPLPRGACEDAIRGGGKGVAGSLAAFADAFERAGDAAGATDPPVPHCGSSDEPATASSMAKSPAAPSRSRAAPQSPGVAPSESLPDAIARGLAALPDRVAELARFGAAELAEYQDARYALRYLDRVARIVIAEARAGGNGAHEVAREAARFLALWMRYDDAIRVASRKARVSRLARIRADAGARGDEVVRVYDLFKPSALEIAAILPRRLGAWLERRALAKAGNGASRSAVPAGEGYTLQTSSFAGALALRSVAAMRPLRPHSLRYAREQQAIEDWLVAIELALANDRRSGAAAALAIARLPRLIRGYGDTHASGRSNFDRILDAYRRTSARDPGRAAAELQASALAALNDPACAPRVPAPAASAARSAAAS
jgi:indolepyruvate ferredoxin oxidoreductase, beta subunit